MSCSTEVHTPQPSSIGDYVRQGSYRLAAQQMVCHLGTLAAGCALDRRMQAHQTRNARESGFWAQVCREIIAMQTAGQTAGQASDRLHAH